MSDRLTFLRGTELLASVPEPLVAKIDERLEEVQLQAGEVLFGEGEEGDAVYIVVEGRLRLESGGMTLIERNCGDCVGEIALIDDEPRSAAAIAETPVKLLRWERRDFQETLGQDPEIARGIFKMLTGKLREDVKSTVRLERERERWRQDLVRAREIQQGMLPAPRMLTESIELAGICSQASEVGGDFYDYLCPDADSTGLIVGDVTGHGFYAGLFVAMAKSCLHTQSRLSFEPREVMQAIRRTLDLSLQRRLLMSCCYVLFESRARRLHYANAGHPYPYLYRAAEGFLQRLEALDPILGALDVGAGGYAERTLPWEPGDVLVMYTDGVTEARDPEGRMFEHEALEACIAEGAGDAAESLRDRILARVLAHAGDGLQADDLTLVVARAH
ncbi:MAG: SpoIIE family protein phosphatase [Gammaproteobacteria bacterium]|nr:SpoIIE family protein phosphatase [Gammaproteobacteria bacterium]NIR23546.1 SpoIIE family protein phosphatase [Gammaproteobacteria bacterium]NIS05359.1 SpoIIE family protein phosphatase [Gammaproteobacteria bacterium]NIU41743.1 SpoIIE family protein phosphatase [Gammaproteobacteria bacterium]NIV47473.1 SpoIIE family protein phosphatase [Gammaproteobacteria bacterium]